MTAGPGLGAFDLAMQELYGPENIKCVGAPKLTKGNHSKARWVGVYAKHFPTHQLEEPDPHTIQVDMFFARLPTPKSVDAWEVINLIRKYRPYYILIETFFMMKKDEKEEVDNMLAEFGEFSKTSVDAGAFTGHTRKRTYWANWPLKGVRIDKTIEFVNYLYDPDDVLRNLTAYTPNEITRDILDKKRHSDTREPKCKGVSVSWKDGLPGNMLIDRRYKPNLIVRRFYSEELELLLGFPVRWTESLPEMFRVEVLGAASDVSVLKYLLGLNPA